MVVNQKSKTEAQAVPRQEKPKPPTQQEIQRVLSAAGIEGYPFSVVGGPVIVSDNHGGYLTAVVGFCEIEEPNYGPHSIFFWHNGRYIGRDWWRHAVTTRGYVKVEPSTLPGGGSAVKASYSQNGEYWANVWFFWNGERLTPVPPNPPENILWG
ncbi:MAG: hypothetical protein AB1330_02490 [Bacillota bacterium]